MTPTTKTTDANLANTVLPKRGDKASKEAETKKADAVGSALSTDAADKPEHLGVVFRMMNADYMTIKHLSITRRISMQELIEMGLNMLLKDAGLAPLQGMPRNKKKKKAAD